MFSAATITNGPLELDESGRWCSSKNQRKNAPVGDRGQEHLRVGATLFEWKGEDRK